MADAISARSLPLSVRAIRKARHSLPSSVAALTVPGAKPSATDGPD
jgi:hypothetical protein